MAERKSWRNILTDEEVLKLRLRAVNKIFECKKPKEVAATVEFAKYLDQLKVHPDNYVLFMELMDTGNHHVLLALIGNENAETFFAKVETSAYMIHTFVGTLYKFQPGALHPKLLSAILGVLIKSYEEPLTGFKKYQLSLSEINAVGKNLDEGKSQDEEVNRLILDFLNEIGTMKGYAKEDPYFEEIASHAINIRNAFLDKKETLGNKIPELLVERVDFNETSVNPGAKKSLKKSEK